MKFLVSEENWDLQGYKEYLETIQHRFDEQTSKFILNKSFHDGHIKHIKLINHFDRNNEEEIKDPTSIRMIIEHSGGSLYEIVWSEVRRFLFDYDITRHVYSNLNEIVLDGMCGIDEWGYDEILETSDQMLSHEIDLFSETKIFIICRGIQINRLEP